MILLGIYLQNALLFSNIPKEIPIEGILRTETVQCTVRGIKRRQSRFNEGDYSVVLICYESTVTNKIFNHYIDALKALTPLLILTCQEVGNKELKKVRRLKHNIISYTSKIQQELFKLVSQDTVSRATRDQLRQIETILTKNTKNAASAYLKILKNVNFMKAEFAAYDILNNDSGKFIIDPQDHSIYKVIHLSLSSFWLDFIEKDVTVDIERSSRVLRFDYNPVSVSLSHIWDNAVKYTCPDSTIKVSFVQESSSFTVKISMLSLKIYPEEVTKIFSEEYSGISANKLHLAGNGIGMNIVQKLLSINNIKISIDINTSPFVNEIRDGIAYEYNDILLVFPAKSG